MFNFSALIQNPKTKQVDTFFDCTRQSKPDLSYMSNCTDKDPVGHIADHAEHNNQHMPDAARADRHNDLGNTVRDTAPVLLHAPHTEDVGPDDDMDEPVLQAWELVPAGQSPLYEPDKLAFLH